MLKRFASPETVLGLIAITVTAGGVGVAVAASSGGGNTVTGCVSKRTGVLGS